MEASSLRKNRPHLEAILGALAAEDDSNIRTIFYEVDEVLLEIARHFHCGRAGWEGTGLELIWNVSGQVAISSFVGACLDGTKCVEFCIELRPSWYYGERSPRLTWEVETDVYADCQHANHHHGMESVYDATVCVATPLEAAAALRTAARKLLQLATDFPLEHWLELASAHDAA